MMRSIRSIPSLRPGIHFVVFDICTQGFVRFTHFTLGFFVATLFGVLWVAIHWPGVWKYPQYIPIS